MKGLHFYTQGTVLEWDCHMLFSPMYLISMQFFWWSCLSPRNWAKTQEPRHPVTHLHLWSNSPASYQSSPSHWTTVLHPVHPVETVLYGVFQVWKPWDHLAPIWAQMHRETNVITKCFASVEDCTVHLVLPVFPSNAVKIGPCISFHSRDVAFNWL